MSAFDPKRTLKELGIEARRDAVREIAALLKKKPGARVSNRAPKRGGEEHYHHTPQLQRNGGTFSQPVNKQPVD